MSFLITEAVDWKEEIFKWTCLAISGAVILFLLFVVVIVIINVVADWNSKRTKVYDKVAWLGAENSPKQGLGPMFLSECSWDG